MSEPHHGLCVPWKRFGNQVCISLRANQRRPVMGWCETCESICQNPGSGVLQQLQPGHCWLTEAGKQANTKDLTWWDKSMSEKKENLDRLPVRRWVKQHWQAKHILTQSFQFTWSACLSLRLRNKIHVNPHITQSAEPLSHNAADLQNPTRKIKFLTLLTCPYGVFIYYQTYHLQSTPWLSVSSLKLLSANDSVRNTDSDTRGFIPNISTGLILLTCRVDLILFSVVIF